MIETIQFIKWMLRKIFALPGQLINNLAKRLGQGDVLLTILFYWVAVIVAAFGIGILLALLSKGSAIAAYVTIFILLAGTISFIIAVFKILHKAFRSEQQQLIDKLKG